MFCNTCKTEKVESAFYVSNKTNCKECVKSRVRAYRKENIEKVREYDRSRADMPHRAEKNFRVSKAWRTKYPDRARAQSRVAYAVGTGKIIPQPCWVCGEKAGAHHPDYSRPLDVVWLCQAHHKQAHALVPSPKEIT